MADVAVIDIDIGKTSFHLVAVDAAGAIPWEKKFRRLRLMRHIGGVSQCLACASHSVGQI